MKVKQMENNPRLIIKNDGLVVDRIGKSYSKKPVVRSISIQIQKGEAVGLLGPNGAGKTTCFYMISGLISPDYGKTDYLIKIESGEIIKQGKPEEVLNK